MGQQLLEDLLLAVLKKLLTDDVVKGFEASLVAKLKALAADSSNQIDDFMVEVIAKALNVSYP